MWAKCPIILGYSFDLMVQCDDNGVHKTKRAKIFSRTLSFQDVRVRKSNESRENLKEIRKIVYIFWLLVSQLDWHGKHRHVNFLVKREKFSSASIYFYLFSNNICIYINIKYSLNFSQEKRSKNGKDSSRYKNYCLRTWGFSQ